MFLFRRRCKAIYASVFNQQAMIPEYEMQFFYGYPSFKITFQSAKELAEAKKQGLTDAFMKAIAKECKDEGSKDRPFDPSHAVHFVIKRE